MRSAKHTWMLVSKRGITRLPEYHVSHKRIEHRIGAAVETACGIKARLDTSFASKPKYDRKDPDSIPLCSACEKAESPVEPDKEFVPPKRGHYVVVFLRARDGRPGVWVVRRAVKVERKDHRVTHVCTESDWKRAGTRKASAGNRLDYEGVLEVKTLGYHAEVDFSSFADGDRYQGGYTHQDEIRLTLQAHILKDRRMRQKFSA